MISYAGLLFRLSQNHMTRTALGRELKISSRTLARIGRGRGSRRQSSAEDSLLLSLPCQRTVLAGF